MIAHWEKAKKHTRRHLNMSESITIHPLHCSNENKLEYARKTMRCETCEWANRATIKMTNRNGYEYNNDFFKCGNYEETHLFELYHKNFGCIFWSEKHE